MFKKVPVDSVEFVIHLTPGASRETVHGEEQDEKGNAMLKVSVFAHAENNKANTALVKLLAKFFDVPKSDVEIRSGHKSRRKIIVIRNKSLVDNL